MPRRRGDTSGRISVRPFTRRVSGSRLDNVIGIGELYQGSQKIRGTEQEALDHLMLVPNLTKLHRDLIILERIGLNPESFQAVRVVKRPARPLYGAALWAWIGRQPDIQMRAKDVRMWLEEVERIQAARLRAGLG